MKKPPGSVEATMTDLFNLTQRDFTEEFGRHKTPLDLYRLLNEIADLGNCLIANQYKPTTSVGKITQQLVPRLQQTSWWGDATCYESEPRFLQSFDDVHAGRHGFAPAVVYTDQAGVPLIYEKNRGDETALVLRSSGLFMGLPAGTIIDLTNTELWKQEPTPTANPQLVRYVVEEKVERGQVARPSTFILEENELYEWQYDLDEVLRTDGAGQQLVAYGAKAGRFTLPMVVERVDELAAAAGMGA